ncbi:MAG: ATP-binding protein [Crocinitomicaceae bacterium]
MAKIIVGRELEKEKLEASLNSQRSELIAVYGRRRIGKTYLIREFFEGNFVFQFEGLKDNQRDAQIKSFMLKLRDFTDEFQDEKPLDWLDAFFILKNYLKTIRQSKKKKVIFIDEFPWADTQRSGFLSAFESFWNSYCTTRSDLIVVVCGSAASYMLKKVILNRGGLHNRITRRIHLDPFSLKETKAFFQYKKLAMANSDIDILRMYMALGGVAEYLEHIDPKDSSVNAIDRICFQKGAQLQNEFAEVFKSLFDENSYHEQVIHALADGQKKGMKRGEILSAMNTTSSGKFSKCLEELILSGFVQKYDAHRDNRKTTLFRISDEFCLFHLQFIRNFRGNSWTKLYQKQEYITWSGYAFETICLKHVEQIKKGLNCDQITSKNFSWSNSEAQIDLVIDRDDGYVNLCELKFYNDICTVNKDYYLKLMKKESEYQKATKSRKGMVTTMLTTYGVSCSTSLDIENQSLTMDCLFS